MASFFFKKSDKIDEPVLECQECFSLIFDSIDTRLRHQRWHDRVSKREPQPESLPSLTAHSERRWDS